MSDLINFNPLPRKEGDSFLSFLSIVRFNFNPLPRKEGDRKRNVIWMQDGQFQSTPS